MTDNKWRFPGNRHTVISGLDTPDMETFKKDIMSSLAREVCQNSNDAKSKRSMSPVRVEFKPFELLKSDLPGYEALEKQINSCLDYSTRCKTKDQKQLQTMAEKIKNDIIPCLRISDFETTGLNGIYEEQSNFGQLLHGSGMSGKKAGKGGSKGIGKYASFVVSSYNTVFYSTHARNDENGLVEDGYEGIAKLSSADMDNTTEKTLGIGYYADSDEIKVIPEELHFLTVNNRVVDKSLNHA